MEMLVIDFENINDWEIVEDIVVEIWEDFNPMEEDLPEDVFPF